MSKPSINRDLSRGNRDLSTGQPLDLTRLWLVVLCYCLGLGLLARIEPRAQQPLEPSDINWAEISRVLL